MSGFGLLAALFLMLGVGSGVMVFKHHVDDERRVLAELRGDLAREQVRHARLRADLAYHHRPAYLQSLASRLGLVPASPSQLAELDDLPAWPEIDEDGNGPWIVALPSGERTFLLRRAAQGSRP